MTEEIKLDIKERDKSKSPKKIRRKCLIPGVLYGRKEESKPISIDLRSFEKVWKDVGGSSIITLKGLDEDKDVLIYEVAEHPLTGEPIHVDFYAIEQGKKLHTTVPLEFIGVAPAVKEKGGNLVKVFHEIEVESLPRNLPSEIQVDVSILDDFEKQIQVKDLSMPEGVVPTADPEDTVALVSEGREEVEEEISEEPDLSSIEVEKKGKNEEEEDGGETPKEE